MAGHGGYCAGMYRHRIVTATAGISALLLPLAAHAASGGMVPHRAVYDMRLMETRESSDIATVSGKLVLEWQGSTCDGYITSQRIVNRMGSKKGSPFVSDFRVNTWESGDGDTFTFSMVHYVDGKPIEEIEGDAERGKKGGHADFSSPDDAGFDLPANVVFPTEQVRKMIAAGLRGDKVMASPVFDGSDYDHYFATTTFFGGKGEGAPEGKEAEPAKPLADVAWWPVQVSYFDPADRAGLPEYEVSFRFYANGISTGLVMDYGDLVLGADLVELELLPVPEC